MDNDASFGPVWALLTPSERAVVVMAIGFHLTPGFSDSIKEWHPGLLPFTNWGYVHYALQCCICPETATRQNVLRRCYEIIESCL